MSEAQSYSKLPVDEARDGLLEEEAGYTPQREKKPSQRQSWLYSAAIFIPWVLATFFFGTTCVLLWQSQSNSVGTYESSFRTEFRKFSPSTSLLNEGSLLTSSRLQDPTPTPSPSPSSNNNSPTPSTTTKPRNTSTSNPSTPPPPSTSAKHPPKSTPHGTNSSKTNRSPSPPPKPPNSPQSTAHQSQRQVSQTPKNQNDGSSSPPSTPSPASIPSANQPTSTTRTTPPTSSRETTSTWVGSPEGAAGANRKRGEHSWIIALIC
jgi:hypothetical protein